MALYKSWVPNVSGCLSFSNIKGSRITGRAKAPQTHNFLSDRNKKFIYSLQLRNLSDTLYHRFDESGKFYFQLSAHVDENDHLLGHVYIYPLTSLAPVEKQLVKAIEKCEQDPTNEVQQLINKRTYSDNDSTKLVKFSLDRDGIITLECDEPNEELCHSFVLEAFSFLRDLIHTHKFHRTDDDAIIVPYKEEVEGDLAWVRETARNIHKSIVSSYRNTSYPGDLINAIGRLEYLESFHDVIRKRGWERLVGINTQTLRSSLETRGNALRKNDELGEVISQIIIPTVFAILAFFIGMMQLLQLPCVDGLSWSAASPGNCAQPGFKIPPAALDFAQWVLTHWFQITLACTGGIALLLAFFRGKLFFQFLGKHMGEGPVWWVQQVILSLAIGAPGRLGASLIVICMMMLILYVIHFLSLQVFDWSLINAIDTIFLEIFRKAP